MCLRHLCPTCDGTVGVFTDDACSACGPDRQPCAVFASPTTSCMAYEASPATHALFERASGTPTPLVEEDATFVGDPVATYCCREYGPD